MDGWVTQLHSVIESRIRQLRTSPPDPLALSRFKDTGTLNGNITDGWSCNLPSSLMSRRMNFIHRSEKIAGRDLEEAAMWREQESNKSKVQELHKGRSLLVDFTAKAISHPLRGFETTRSPESRDKIMSAGATSEIWRVPCPHLG